MADLSFKKCGRKSEPYARSYWRPSCKGSAENYWGNILVCVTANSKVAKFESSSWKLVPNISQLFQCYMVSRVDSSLRPHVVSSPEKSLGLLPVTYSKSHVLVIRPKFSTCLCLWAFGHFSSTFYTSSTYVKKAPKPQRFATISKK